MQYTVTKKAVPCLKICTCDMITCKRFKRNCWLHQQGRTTHLVTHGGRRFLCNVTNIYHNSYRKISGDGCLQSVMTSSTVARVQVRIRSWQSAANTQRILLMFKVKLGSTHKVTQEWKASAMVSLGMLMRCYFTLAAVPSAWQWGYCEQSE